MKRKPTAARAEPEADEELVLESAEPGGLGDPGDPGAPAAVRLNKFLADNGVASRRRCDELIAEGKVTIDGETVTALGTRVDPERQAVEIDGFVLKPGTTRRRYYLLNKPAGVVCTNEARELRPRAIDLITDPRKGRIYTVGRLDEESKGLILLTNDGAFAQRITHPSFGIEKTYLVRVLGRIDDAALQKIRHGIHLSEGRTAGARVIVEQRQRESSYLSVTIHEGMNREIRRAFARVGFKVTELKRVRIGALTDRGLKIGRWRELARNEVAALLVNAPPAAAAPARRGGGRRGAGQGRPKPSFSGRPGLVRAQSGERDPGTGSFGRRDPRRRSDVPGRAPGRASERGAGPRPGRARAGGGAARGKPQPRTRR